MNDTELENKLKILKKGNCCVIVILKKDWPCNIDGTDYFEIIGEIESYGYNSKGAYPCLKLKKSETHTKLTQNGKPVENPIEKLIFIEIITYERIKDVVERTYKNAPIK